MKRLVIILSIILLSILGFFLYETFAFVNVLVKFDELEPMDKKMKVYFKGFKIGKTARIYPDENYQNTYVKLKLYPYNINLPENIQVEIKKLKSGLRYVDVIYPDSPSVARLKNNGKIKGEFDKDIHSVLSDSLDEERLDEIVTDATTLMESANTTVQNLGDVFLEVKEILQNSKKDIKVTTSNLAKMSDSLENLADNLNTSLSKEPLQNSVNNIEETTKNIKEITKNLNDITNQIDRTTMPLVNSTLCHTNEITGGIKNTLKKRMGLGKLMFGRPISNDCNN